MDEKQWWWGGIENAERASEDKDGSLIPDRGRYWKNDNILSGRWVHVEATEMEGIGYIGE